ncbi:MAG: anti-sigma factor family protein [Pyrinomonadaceae bacterium]
MSMCLDEGMLQAYLDGELPAAQMEATAQHLAACATCAELAHEAEHEYALFSTAFAPVLSTPPPTERLRARLEETIADLQAPPRRITETPTSRLRAWWGTLAAAFAVTPRQAAAFASFLLAVALTITLTMLRPQSPPIEQAAKNPGGQPSTIVPDGGSNPTPSSQGDNALVATTSGANGGNSDRISIPPAKFPIRNERRPAANRPNEARPLMPSPAPLLPEEKNYLRTIATLDAAIKAQGVQALPPSLRAEYERNIAVVDEQIIATRVAARRNPQSTDAKEFLRAAYQNKVDLLTTVADQTQFIAARD